jgi:NAD(P)-dependent dehydrogenase (short-subunit alcohol dehydrogenase family)
MNTPVVLITGALTGIGRATALAFAHEGARVVISGRREEAGNKLAAELRALGAEAEFLPSGVRHEDEVRSLVDKTVARFGRLDVAVNNAGTEGKPGPVTEQSAESYAATFDTNVLGTLLSMKHELRVMQAQGHGIIVNLSSTTGSKAAPGASVYTASKHAVEGLTKSAALEGSVRRACQRSRPWSGRNRDAESVHRQRRTEGRFDCGRAAQTRRDARGDRPDHRVSRVGQGVFHHGSHHRRGRWQIGSVTRVFT